MEKKTMLKIKRCLCIATAMLFTFTLAQSLGAAEVLKVATAFPQKAFAYKGLEKLAEHVKTKTNGEYELQLFPGGQLGIDREMFQQMKMGTLHFAMLTNASPVALKEGKNFNATAAPYVFNSDEEYYSTLGGLYMYYAEDIPKPKEEIIVGEYKLIAEKVTQNRIIQITLDKA